MAEMFLIVTTNLYYFFEHTIKIAPYTLKGNWIKKNFYCSSKEYLPIPSF